MARHILARMHPIVTIAAFQFLPLDALRQRQAQLLAQCKGWGLQGSIVLSPEGIHLLVAGGARQIDLLLAELRSWPGLQALQPRLSGSERLRCQRMTVRIKQELIAFGVCGIEPARSAPAALAPHDLKQWLDEARPLLLLDVRNDAEVQLGTFEQAQHAGIRQFREFPAAAAKLDAACRHRPIVVFCTDGLRSTKAALFLQRCGFTQVFQLAGGILGYFEHCGSAHFAGECLLLEQQSVLDPGAVPQWVQCSRCRTVLDAAEQAHAHYAPGQHCPYCYQMPAARMTATLQQRHQQLRRLITPLPGSIPRDHLRPVSIPAACDGLTLLAALSRIVPHIPSATWAQRCGEGCLLDESNTPCSAARIVRGGERYHHKFANLTEPDVNMQIELLHEEEALLVLNKPAPLPMHEGGRFHRNTLKFVLDGLYHPQQPRPAHRLDANTTGVVVVARTGYIAGRLQPQFARGEVQKTYLVRVHGHPPDEEFECAAPISSRAGELGSRSVDLNGGGLQALTRFKVLRRDSASTLLEARPLTGRTNQIRVHLWHLGWPVVGDPAYVSGGVLGDSQTLPISAPPLCLHAWRISFQHPVRREIVTFTAPEPSWTRSTA